MVIPYQETQRNETSNVNTKKTSEKGRRGMHQDLHLPQKDIARMKVMGGYTFPKSTTPPWNRTSMDSVISDFSHHRPKAILAHLAIDLKQDTSTPDIFLLYQGMATNAHALAVIILLLFSRICCPH